MSATIDPAALLAADELAAVERTAGKRLRFTPAVERAYRQHIALRRHLPLVKQWLISLVLFDLFLFTDYHAAPDDVGAYAVGRFGVVTPLCLVVWLIATRSQRCYEYVVCLPQLFMTMFVSVAIIIFPGEYRGNYLLSNILIMICGSVLSRTRLSFTLATILLQSLIFGIGLFGSDAISVHSKPIVLPFFVSSAVIAFLTAYTLDQGHRLAFVMESRITKLNRELEASASTDPLTGLANRRGLAHATDRLWDDNAPATLVSLILIDLDRFKSFNDNYGHGAGDRCLATIAKQIVSVLRPDDDLAVRFGGEELLVLLPGLDLAAAQRVAERIRLAIAAAQVPHPALGPGAVVSASLGVATATTRECSSLELTARADSALYAAKGAGRNCVWPPLAEPTDAGKAGMMLSPAASQSAAVQERRAATEA